MAGVDGGAGPRGRHGRRSGAGGLARAAGPQPGAPGTDHGARANAAGRAEVRRGERPSRWDRGGAGVPARRPASRPRRWDEADEILASIRSRGVSGLARYFTTGYTARLASARGREDLGALVTECRARAETIPQQPLPLVMALLAAAEAGTWSGRPESAASLAREALEHRGPDPAWGAEALVVGAQAWPTSPPPARRYVAPSPPTCRSVPTSWTVRTIRGCTPSSSAPGWRSTGARTAAAQSSHRRRARVPDPAQARGHPAYRGRRHRATRRPGRRTSFDGCTGPQPGLASQALERAERRR